MRVGAPDAGRGTGLGMMYGAPAQSGGDVTIDSAPGEATTACIFLPALGSPKPDGATAIVPASEERGGMKDVELLYVEDEPLVEMATTETLEAAGFRVHAVADGKRALAILQDHPGIDLVITDVGLPGMSGHELVSEARRLKPHLKVVFVTGYDRAGTVARMAADQNTDFIEKPYEPEALVAAVRRLLPGRSVGDA